MTSHELLGVSNHQQIENPNFQSNNKENIKALYHWPFVRGIQRLCPAKIRNRNVRICLLKYQFCRYRLFIHVLWITHLTKMKYLWMSIHVSMLAMPLGRSRLFLDSDIFYIMAVSELLYIIPTHSRSNGVNKGDMLTLSFLRVIVTHNTFRSLLTKKTPFNWFVDSLHNAGMVVRTS